jgi:hypothetical protein
MKASMLVRTLSSHYQPLAVDKAVRAPPPPTLNRCYWFPWQVSRPVMDKVPYALKIETPESCLTLSARYGEPYSSCSALCWPPWHTTLRYAGITYKKINILR